MRLLFALFASAGMALATGFDGTWDATILAGGDLVPFRLEVSESPARVCFFEDTQPVCSTAARIEAGKLIAQWDYLRRELRLEIAGGGLQGVYHSLRTGSDLAVQAKPHQPPSQQAQPAVDLAGGGLQGVYHSLRTGSDLAVQAKPHQPPSQQAQPAVDLAGGGLQGVYHSLRTGSDLAVQAKPHQ